MRLSWTAPALGDLRQIGLYLRREASPDTSVRILKRIRERSSQLQAFPHLGPIVTGKDLRSLHVRDTPYILLYRACGDEVEILRVHHERENWRA